MDWLADSHRLYYVREYQLLVSHVTCMCVVLRILALCSETRYNF